jgi:hypothetical protein
VRRLVLVLIGLAVSPFAASPAEAVRSEFFGISEKRQLDDQDLQKIAATGVRTDRIGFDWKLVEKTQGSFRWVWTDQVVGDLAAHRIRSFPFVWGSPTWVASKPSIPPTASGDEQAWQYFLKAAVSRYGPGGSYWANGYRQQHPGATPLPIQSWQVWNEPNLEKYFDPGGTADQLAQKYARLLRISHDAIKSRDPQARIVLAGMPGYPPSGGPRAWDFLKLLYRVPGIKGYFDVAALHPYSRTLDQFRFQIQQVRAVMVNHGDGGTPLWLTEIGWGSGPPDQFGRNVGPSGQQRMLSNSFSTVLNHRSAWNVQRLYWFLWRDPAPGSPFASRCSFCGTGGLLYYDRTPKPAYWAYRGFAAEKTPPQASITSGPAQGGFTKDSTPSFSFASNEPGSTFTCHFDAQPFSPCSSPLTRALPLSNGAHAFYVKAIDAPGNESAVVSRSFTVDTVAP